MSSESAMIDALACGGEEICHQIIFLSNVRAKINFNLPIFRLPPETLAIIFILGARDYYNSNYGGHFTPCIPAWVNVSYVCSRWRNIALDCPSLWAYHFNVSLPWTEELLLRSKQVPLKISCIYQSRRYKEVSWRQSLLEKLLKHSGRIQELCLNVPLSFLPSELALCSPRLEKLEIRLWWGISKQCISIADGDRLPLHTLRLIDCSLSWNLLNLSGLKTLSLRNVHSSSSPDMAQFLAMLSSMQDLSVLHLVHVLPSARDFLSSGALSSYPKIDLPRLTSLAVVAPLSTVAALVSCVNIPFKIQLGLQPLAELGSTVGDYAPISSFLAQQFNQQSPGSTFHSLILDAGYIPSLTFRLESEPISPLEEAVHSMKIALGEILYGDTIQFTESDTHRILSNICCSLPLTNIQSIHIMWPQSSTNILEEILGRLDGLRRLKLSYGRMPNLSMLSPAPRGSNHNPGGQHIPGQDQTQGHVLVPALEELELYRIAFLPDHVSSQSHMSQKSLFDTLSTRGRLRDRLTMTECKFT